MIFAMEEFDKLWEQRDVLSNLPESEIDKMVRPLSGGLPLRAFNKDQMEKYKNGTSKSDKQYYRVAFKRALQHLFTHMQVCCSVCHEVVPSWTEKWNNNGTLEKIEVNTNFNAPDAFSWTHWDHRQHPESGKIIPSELVNYNKEIAKEQLLCCDLVCAG